MFATNQFISSIELTGGLDMTSEAWAQDQTSDQEAFQQAVDYIAEQRMAGRSGVAVTDELVEAGWDREEARDMVVQVTAAMRDPEQHAEQESSYGRHIVVGALWAIGGTVVTVATYSAASGGGSYVVAWGAIVFGAIECLYGVFGALTSR